MNTFIKSYIKKLIRESILSEDKKINVQDLAYSKNKTILDRGTRKELNFFRLWLPQRLNIRGRKERDELFDYIDSEKGEIARVPIYQIKPSQYNDDYKNSSSDRTSEIYKLFNKGRYDVSDIRISDFYPILVDKNTNRIINGNHRHYALTKVKSPYAVVLYVDIPEKYSEDLM